jgi:hypothetical protein
LPTTDAPTSTSTATSVTTPTTGLVRAFQVLAVLVVVTVAWQFVSAGQLFPSGGPEEAHGVGAIVLHVLSGLTAVAAVLLWRQRRLAVGPTVLAVVVFAYTFLQAAWGGRSSLWIHVPGAMVLTVGVVLVAVTSFRVTAPRA